MISLCHLWGVGKVLSDCVLLTWAIPYQRFQCLRPIGIASPSLGHAQGNYKAFLWSEYRSWQCTQKISVTVSTSRSTTIWDCSPMENPPKANLHAHSAVHNKPTSSSAECDTLWASVLVVYLYQSAEPIWFQIFHGNVWYTFIP